MFLCRPHDMQKAASRAITTGPDNVTARTLLEPGGDPYLEGKELTISVNPKGRKIVYSNR